MNFDLFVDNPSTKGHIFAVSQPPPFIMHQALISEVSHVTVYTDRAMVTRTVKIHLEPGEQVLRIGNLPSPLAEDTVRVAGRGDSPVKILDFKLRDFSYRDLPEKRLQTLAEEKVNLESTANGIEDQLAGINHQKQFVKGISEGKSKQAISDIGNRIADLEEWKKVMDFIGTELDDLDKKRRQLESELTKIRSEIELIEDNLNRHGGSQALKRKEAHVDLSVSAAGDFVFEVSYLEYKAKWSPSYDVRVDSEKKKVAVRYFGMVSQFTGEDWADVKVKLSTARPYLAGDPPRLKPWYLDIQKAHKMEWPEFAAANQPPEAFESATREIKSVKKQSLSHSLSEEAAYERAEVTSGDGVSVVFTTKGMGDVPGDGSNSKLLIMESEFGSEFRFLTIPKLSQHVYLTTKVENTTDYPLLPGKLNLFLDGNFVGNSNLEELVTPEEQFTLNLGVDESIRVKHKLLKKKGDEKGIWTKSKVQEYAYQINLESHRKTTETVIVRDQLPVSQYEKIKVDLDMLHPPENAEKDKERLVPGTLEWKVVLPARESTHIEFGFTVSYPKDTEVDGV